MTLFISIPILALAAVLQSTIAPQIQILGGRPDLVFLLVLSWSIRGTLDESVLWAFVGGIAQDLLSAAPTGTSVLGMVLLVFVVDLLKQQVYSIGLTSVLTLTFAGTILQQFTHAAVLLVMGYKVSFFDLVYVLFPTLIYNLVLILPAYWFIRRIQRRLGEENTKSF